MNQQQLRRYQIMQELANKQQMQNYQNDKNSYLDDARYGISKFNQYRNTANNLLNSGNKISSLGQNISKFGTKLQSSSNPYLNQLGNKVGYAGTRTTNFGNNMQNGINGLRGRIVASPATSTGTTATGTTGTVGTSVGSGVGGTATTGAGTTLGTTGATTATGAGTTVGTGVGSTMAGSGGAMAGGTAAGTTAGTTAGASAGIGAGAGAGGAAAGGATAAGAAVPVVGWALLAAAAIYSMLNSARQKKQAKALKQTAGAEQRAEQESNEFRQNIAENSMQNQQQLAQQLQNNGMGGLTGMTQEQQPQMTQNGKYMLDAIQQSQGQQNQDQNSILDSATSVIPPTVQGTMSNKLMGGVADLLGVDNNTVNQSQLTNPLNQNQGTAINNTQPTVTNTPSISGTPTGYAAPAIQQQPQQLSGSVSQVAQPQPQSQQAPAFGSQVYQTGGGSGKIASLIDQFRQGYQDNTNNTLGNTYFAPGQQKTFANRLGEFVGTGQRIASNPLVQGAIAGGINYANGGNFGNSALVGVNWARDKANSDRYEQLINGGNKRSMLGGYTAQDYNAKLAQDWKNQQQQNWQSEQQYKKDKDERDYNYKVEKDTRDYNYKKSKDDREYNEKVRHNKTTEGISQQRINQYAKQHGVSQKQAEERLKLQRDKLEFEKQKYSDYKNKSKEENKDDYDALVQEMKKRGLL